MKFSFVLALLALLSGPGCTKSSPQNESGVAATASAPAPPSKDLGVGPVKTLSLETTVKADLAKQGKALFDAKCAACHKMDERYVGPGLKGVTHRREPEWIMNMIMNPQEMTQKNEKAKELLGEYMIQMTFQNLKEDETRAILEYFRQVDSK